MNVIKFSICALHAWAPGLTTPDAWLQWCQNPVAIKGTNTEQPRLTAIHPMLRRRVDFQGKMALSVSSLSLEEEQMVPVIWCSRHGEVKRSVAILENFVSEGTVSPAAFSMSVHNAVAGVFSIVQSNLASYTAMAAKENMVPNALIEAYTMLEDGMEQVLLVVYSNCLPEPFSQYADRPEMPFAWSCLICPAIHKDIFELSWSSTDSVISSGGNIPQELEILKFLMGKDAVWQTAIAGKEWILTRV